MKPKVLMVILPYVVKNIDATRPKIRSYLGLPYGVLSVVTYNKDIADFQVLDLNIQNAPLSVMLSRKLEEFKPDVVGFSMMFDNSYAHLRPLLRNVKSYDQNIHTLLGGAAASYSYEEIMAEQPNLDAICYSEGEIPMEDLLSNQDMTSASWITRRSLSRGITPRISFIQNLDEVIDIDYSYINPDDYGMAEAFSPFVDYGKPHKRFFLVTSRGCPYSCTFCNNHLIHGHKMRYASVDRIIAHVKHLVDTYGMDVLILYDDQLLFNTERAKELFRKLERFAPGLRIEMPNGLTVAFIDDELAGLMKAAGVDTVYLAIESGSPYVLKELIHKPLKLEMVKPAVEALRKRGIFIHGFFVMGYPQETDAHRKETYDFCREIDLDWCAFNMATPVRGSKLYDDCIKNGWITKQKISEIVDKAYIIHVPGTDPEQIERDVYQMNLDLNFHNNRRMRIGDYQTAARCFEEVLRRYSGHKWARHYLDICLTMQDIGR